MKRRNWLTLAVIALFIVPPLALMRNHAKEYEQQQAQREVFYSKDIVPIIQKHCITCHAEENEHPSELFMDSYESLTRGGRHGKTVVPGNATESLMHRKLLPNPPFGRMMPPSKKLKLSEEQIEAIRLWIEQGARKN